MPKRLPFSLKRRKVKHGKNFHLGKTLAHPEIFSFFTKQQIKLGIFIEERFNINLQILKLQIS